MHLTNEVAIVHDVAQTRRMRPLVAAFFLSLLLLLTVAASAVAAPVADPTAPDPGGDPSIDQPVPATGKAFGFNLGLDPAGLGDPIPIGKGVAGLVATHATHQREPFNWVWLGTASTQTQPVHADFSSPLGGATLPALKQFDAKYTALVAANVTPIIVFQYAPAWASIRYQCDNALYKLLNPTLCNGKYHPANWAYTQYRAVIAALATRYPAAIFEGPNEVDHESVSNPTNQITATQLANEQCELYAAVKSVDPNRLVLSPSLDDWFARGYTAGYLSGLGVRTCHDVFSTHPYTSPGNYGAGTAFATIFKQIRAARTTYGDTSPIWVTETGISTTDGSPPFSEATQAAALRAIYNKLAAMTDVEGVLIHTLRDQPATWLTTGREAGFGVLRTDWTPKPSFCWFAAQAGGTYSGC